MSKSKTKQRKAQQDDEQLSLQNPERPAWFRWTIIGLCLLVGGAGTYYAFDRFIWAKIPNEMVGRWGVEGGPQDGATLEFFRNGKLVAQVNVDGRHGVIRSDVSVEGKTLKIVATHPTTGEKKTQLQTIRKLTRDELVLEDENGVTFRMIRLD